MIIHRILQYNDVFTENPLSIKDYLQTIPKNVLIQALAHFNGYFKHKSKYNRNYFDFLNNFFQDANNDVKDHVIRQIRILEREAHATPTKIEIIDHLGILLLMEDALSIENDLINEENFDKKLTEINLFKAILIKNQQIDIKQTEGYGNIPDSAKIDTPLLPLLLITTLPDTEFNNRLDREVFMCQVVKAKLLFDFIENNQQCAAIYSELLAAFGVTDRKEIFKHLMNLCSFALLGDEGHITINIPDDANFDSNCAFLDIFSNVQVGTDYDFRFLRASPLYKLKKGQYTVIHKIFLFEKIYKGWYFKLSEINDKLPKEQKIKEFKSFWGQSFTEDYLLRKVLEGVFSPKSKHFSGNEIKTNFPTVISEPDYYARDWDKVYLFENKDTLLKAEAKTSYNYVELEQELKEKLYESNKGSAKAVKQLVGNVEKVLTNTLVFDTISKPAKADIYSILVLHEDCFNAQGLNYLVNQWFVQELQILKNNGLDVKRVRPLTIITIDTLILLKDLLVTKKASLNKLLDEYTDKHLKKKTNSIIPFSAFISFKYPNLMPNKQEFTDMALSLAF
ncbi:MAG: hypothetical protein MUF43_02170 [Flavobacterium sp.]|jgi:hypothetical protein|nr:hypothetical protein [Flavobacterium sp.]